MLWACGLLIVMGLIFYVKIWLDLLSMMLGFFFVFCDGFFDAFLGVFSCDFLCLFVCGFG